MFKGGFEIEASEVAERLTIETLPEQEQRMLVNGYNFDPTTHDAYRFFIAPEIEILDEAPHWKKKRISFEQVSRVLVNIERSHLGISLWGMYPTTLLADGSWELDLSGSAVLNPVAPGVGSLKLAAEGKKIVRQKNRPWIKAHRTDKKAQWIFFKEWLENSAEFRFQVVCIVSKEVPSDKRSVKCDVKFGDNGRVIKKLVNHCIRLPA